MTIARSVTRVLKSVSLLVASSFFPRTDCANARLASYNMLHNAAGQYPHFDVCLYLNDYLHGLFQFYPLKSPMGKNKTSQNEFQFPLEDFS